MRIFKAIRVKKGNNIAKPVRKSLAKFISILGKSGNNSLYLTPKGELFDRKNHNDTKNKNEKIIFLLFSF